MKNVYFQFFSVAAIFFTSSVYAQTVVFEENFDAGIPSNFIMYNEDGRTPHESVSEYTQPWIAKADPFDETNTVASATSYFSPIGMADRYLITPAIAIGAVGNSFSWTARSHDASFPERYLVLASKTGTDIEDFQDTLLRVINEEITWTNHTVDLTEAGLADETIHIAFVLRSINGFKFYMDSLKVVINDPVSIQSAKPSEFAIYPNPTNEVISIKGDLEIKKLVVRDIKGTIVLESNDSKDVKVDHLLTGVYFVEVKTAQGVTTKRFIKK